MYILGISAYYHDSAACLTQDGEIIAAAQEERFTRIKHDSGFPEHAILSALSGAGINARQLDHVVFYDKPLLKFERLLETYLAYAPQGLRSFSTAIPIWLKGKLFQKALVVKELNRILGKDVDWKQRLLFSEHHLSHAASAFFPSPFEEALVLTMVSAVAVLTISSVIGLLCAMSQVCFPHSCKK
jgi:carbamoyltransferase